MYETFFTVILQRWNRVMTKSGKGGPFLEFCFYFGFLINIYEINLINFFKILSFLVTH
jgi:hypothetical protein